MILHKKFILFFSFLIVVFAPFFVCTAASGDVAKEQDVDLWILANSKMQTIYVQSCDGQSLRSFFNWNIRPNQSKDFCLALLNSSPQDVNIEYWFTDYSLNKNNVWACSETINTGAFFSRILDYWTSVALVPSNWYAVIHFSLKAPSTGQIQWCVSYRSLDDALTAGMFNIVYRKTDIVNLVVAGKYYWLFDQTRDFVIWLKNNKTFWIWFLVVLWWVFVYVLVKKPSDKKHKHNK